MLFWRGGNCKGNPPYMSLHLSSPPPTFYSLHTPTLHRAPRFHQQTSPLPSGTQLTFAPGSPGCAMVPRGSPWFPRLRYGSPWFPRLRYGSPWFPKLPLRFRSFYLIPKPLLRVPTFTHIPELRSSIGLQSRNPFAFLNFGLSLISLCLSFSTSTSIPISVSTLVPIPTSIPIPISYPDFDFDPAGILVYVHFLYSLYSFLVVPFLL